MKARCSNPKHPKYPLYGAKGITVCAAWADFEGFYRDMGPRPKGRTLDRIDPQKGYYKENCRWATIRDQQNHLTNVKHYAFQGKMMTLTEISEITGIKKVTLHYRVTQGWPDDLIASQPSGRSAAYRKARQAN